MLRVSIMLKILSFNSFILKLQFFDFLFVNNAMKSYYLDSIFDFQDNNNEYASNPEISSLDSPIKIISFFEKIFENISAENSNDDKILKFQKYFLDVMFTNFVNQKNLIGILICLKLLRDDELEINSSISDIMPNFSPALAAISLKAVFKVYFNNRLFFSIS